MAVGEHDEDHRPSGALVPAPVVEVTGQSGAETPGPMWPKGARLLVAAAVVVLLLGAVAVAVTITNPGRLSVAFSGGSTGSGSTVPDGGRVAGPDSTGPDSTGPDSAGPDGGGVAGRALTAPLAGRDRAAFELVDGLTTFNLRTDDLGEDLYRITSPAGGGVVPRPETVEDGVRLRMADSGTRGPGVVGVVLNSRVTWRLRLAGGVTEQVLDLTRGRLSGVELAAGAARTDLRLPRITGTLTVRMSAGANQLVVRVPGSVPARVRLGAGAGSVTVYDGHRSGVAAGTLVGSPQWDRSVDRVYVDLAAGANAVTVEGG
ncbi:hypothetical protein ACH4OY_10450 [Micromonospora rubida]|uniref:Adhesin domain-containing protein n=1 Tax=Micromonospora rubida TaxID=2697657 RepID=A0ABW7SJM3_9ACTN